MSTTIASRTACVLSALPTLADLLARISSDDSLPLRRRQDVASALRCLAKALGRQPEEIRADPAGLRVRLKYFPHAMAGLSARRWRNILSLLRFALDHAGLTHVPGRACTPLATKWAALFINIVEDRIRYGLSRFMHYSSERGIDPEMVNDAVLAAFKTDLETDGLIEKPRQVHRATCALWNQATKLVPGWPDQAVEVPCYSRTYAVPWDRFPATLTAEIDAYFERLSGKEPLAEVGFKPLRPRSLKTRRGQLHNYLSALVQRGHDPQALTCMRDIVAVPVVKEGLRFFLARVESGSGKHAYDIACLLLAIARHGVRVEAAQVEELKGICRRLKPQNRGQTKKNRDRLHQFKDPANLEALCQLPRKLVRAASQIKPANRAAALKVQSALMVELLLMIPMRVGNLRDLRLDQHIIHSSAGMVRIAIPGIDVKNGVDIDAILPQETADLFQLYVDRYRPLLLNGQSDWLFPGRKPSDAKSLVTVQQQITKCVKRECGLDVNPHLFRHLAGELILNARPGDYGTVRLINGHKSMETTIRFYCGTETQAAFRQLDILVQQVRDQPVTAPGRPQRRLVKV